MRRHGSDLIIRWLGLMLGLCAGVTLVVLVIISNPPQDATVDLSWPNCQSIPVSTFRTAVIGINGGLDFHSNPCAADEASQSLSYSFYVNSGNPGFPRIRLLGSSPLSCASYKGKSSLECYSFNYGYQAAQYSIRQADLDGLHSGRWWIDVESVNSWSSNKYANRADIGGMLEALGSQLFPTAIGIYTANNQWHQLVGNWDMGLPLWLGTGLLELKGTQGACNEKSVTGGPVTMVQYTLNNIDFNVICRPLPSLKLGFNFIR